jgi:hypothetical protein
MPDTDALTDHPSKPPGHHLCTLDYPAIVFAIEWCNKYHYKVSRSRCSPAEMIVRKSKLLWKRFYDPNKPEIWARDKCLGMMRSSILDDAAAFISAL